MTDLLPRTTDVVALVRKMMIVVLQERTETTETTETTDVLNVEIVTSKKCEREKKKEE
jgi:hypothetical protein